MSSEQGKDDEICLQDMMEWCSDSFIHYACRNGLSKVVKELIACKADLNVFDEEKFTPLHWTAFEGNTELTKELIENGAEIDAADGTWGSSPLLFAAQAGWKEVIQILLNAGANINFKSESGYDAIYFATEGEHTNIVKLLIECGIDIDPTNIHYASATEQIDIIKLLLDHGVDINSKTQSGHNCLHYAVYNNRYATAKFLMSRGADINAKANRGHTSLHHAAREGHIDIVKLLLENGASIDEKNMWIVTPLHGAARAGHFGVVNLLLQKGANVNSIDEDGDTPLHLAIRSKNISIEVTKILLDFGADFKKKNKNGKSALVESKSLSRKDVLNTIMDKIIEIQLEQSKVKISKPIQVKIDECVICDNPREGIFSFLPCGHAKTCELCCLRLIAMSGENSICPICRSKITDYLKIFV